MFLLQNHDYLSVLRMLYFTCFISVDGNYSEWSEFMQCSVTCGKGVQTRSRSCINPPPQHGGKNCSAFGPPVETKECNLKECPSKNLCFQFVIFYLFNMMKIKWLINPALFFLVDGGYSPFTNWSDCTETCGGGEQIRTRTCTNPEPKLGGKDCSSFGLDYEKRKCNTQKCPGQL